MTDIAAEPKTEPAKPSKLPLIIGVLLGILGAGAGYFVTSSGMFFGSESAKKIETPVSGDTANKVAFVPLDPLTISLPGQGGDRYLRFRAELEVNPAHVSDVELVRPRVIDILNGYLRAVELQDLQNPAALVRLRAQMLRRVQLVTGPDHVNDLLIMEFVVN